METSGWSGWMLVSVVVCFREGLEPQSVAKRVVNVCKFGCGLCLNPLFSSSVQKP